MDRAALAELDYLDWGIVAVEKAWYRAAARKASHLEMQRIVAWRNRGLALFQRWAERNVHGPGGEGTEDREWTADSFIDVWRDVE